MYNSFELFFSGASAARWWRLECKRLFCYSAKSVTEKNNSRVDCAEADKKTVQAQRNEGRGFLAAGGCPAELPVIYFQTLVIIYILERLPSSYISYI